MNRLQKKCIIATAGAHLLLVLILIVGPAFFNPERKPNDAPLDVIPADAVEAALNNGVKNATPPPPQPVVQPQPPQPQQQPPPPAPKPPEPKPSIVDEVKKYFKPEPKPEPVKPASKPAETPKHKIEVDTTHLVTRNAPRNTTNPRDAKAVARAIRNLKSNLKSGTQINLSGSSDVASVNYASVVRSIYDAAWTLPNTIAKDENITVKVTIASDGTVISSRIITPSGDAPADDSVQRALDRVKFIQAFPEGSTDKERSYTIVFNPQVKSSE